MSPLPVASIDSAQTTQDFELLALHRCIHQSNRNFRLGLGQGQELIKLGLTNRPAAAMTYRLTHRITVNPGMLAPEGIVTGALAADTTTGTFLEQRRAGILYRLTDANLFGLRREVARLERWQKHLVVPIPQDTGADAFGRYLDNLVREFQPSAIIIGNEENLHDIHVEGQNRIQWYVDRFVTGHRAVKRADPLVSVHMYGEAYHTLQDNRPFLQGVLGILQKRGVLPDALLVHFYDHANLLQPWLDEISAATTHAIQQRLPIIIGELGHYGDVIGGGNIVRRDAESEQRLTPDDQSRAVAQLLTAATASIAKQAFYFGAIDTISTGGYESRKGLTVYNDSIGNMTPRPALTVFRFVTDLLAGASASLSSTPEHGLSVAHFVRPPLTPDEERDLEGWFVWANDRRGLPREFTLPPGFVGYDVYGRMQYAARDEPQVVRLHESLNPHIGGETFIFFRLTGNTAFPLP
ncbi:MAG: hypothetical protein OXE05_07170 [Chloroflexi bacterium]|nr:hypothetical protein [Chloroflexota bacterium]